MYNGRCYVLELRRAEFASFEMEHFKILVKVNHLKAVSALTVEQCSIYMYKCTSYYRLHVKHGLSWDGTPSASSLPTVVAQGNLMSS